MRILHVNKFLHRRGGAEAYMADLAELQRGAGHEVAFFGMHHPDNGPQRYAAHFPSYVEFAEPSSLAERARAMGRMLWSSSAARGIDAVVEDFRPEVVHLHNIYHQLSPSVLRPLARRGIPAVMTLHDYKLACPTYQFLDKGEICEACLGGHFQQAVRRRCKDGSLGASTAAAAELYLHTATGAYSPVGTFICPSRFLAAKMEAAGVFPDRLRHVPHFVSLSTATAARPGEGVVFAGRLSREKGVDTLIHSVARLGPGVSLHVAGEGPDMAALRALASTRAPGQVRFHGRLSKERLHDLVRSAAVVALPSRWYENQPMVALEAFACGVPIVGSDIGGIPELIDDGVDGRLVPPGDVDGLAAALGSVLDDPARAFAMGRAGRAKAERQFDPSRHLERLEACYLEASTVGAARG